MRSEASTQRHRAYMREYSRRNSTRIALYQADYREKNREKLTSYKSAWDEKNADKIGEYWKRRHKDTYVPSPNGWIVTGKGRPNVMKATRSPTDRDLAWAAGFLEGEGCFSKNVGRSVSAVGNARVHAGQVQREPLERLLEIFGGSLSKPRWDGKLNHQPVYVWSVTGMRARGVMMTLYLFMSPLKKDQIITALHGQKKEYVP